MFFGRPHNAVLLAILAVLGAAAHAQACDVTSANAAFAACVQSSNRSAEVCGCHDALVTFYAACGPAYAAACEEQAAQAMNALQPGAKCPLSCTAFGGARGDLYVMGNTTCGTSGAAPDLLVAPNGREVSAVALGGHHCAFVADGELYVMGDNRHGQLGVGGPRSYDTPQPVPAPNNQSVRALALGQSHSAFIAGGDLYVMGLNTHGRLGLGATAGPFATPQQVVPPNHRYVSAVAFGRDHGAFIAGGALYVMGRNTYGQLGLGGTLAGPVGWTTPQLLPSPNREPVRGLALGEFHSAFIAGGELFVMGRNDRGQCGLGTTGHYYATPQRLPPPNGRRVTRVAVCGTHGAFIAGGQLYVWGANDDGALGLAEPFDQVTPQLLAPPNGKAVTHVAVGAHGGARRSGHTLFVAGGALYVTGSNTEGQLGLGHRQAVAAPQPLPSRSGGSVVTLAAAGGCSAFVLGSTDTPTATATRSLTPTAGASLSPSPSPTPSLSPTATPSSTPEPSRSPSVTAPPTPTPSGTPRATPSPTARPSLTLSFSPTATPTATQTSMLCVTGREAPVGARGVRLAMQSKGNVCVQTFTLHEAWPRYWAALLSRSVAVDIEALEGAAVFTFRGRCQSGRCSETHRATERQRVEYPMRQFLSGIELQVAFKPNATRNETARLFAARATPVHAASRAVVLLLGVGTAVLVLGALRVSWWRARAIAAQSLPEESPTESPDLPRPPFSPSAAPPEPDPEFRHPHWTASWVAAWVGLVSGLCLLGAGALWLLVLNLLRHPLGPVSPAMYVGAAIAAAGLGCVALALWHLRDDAPLHCPVCRRPVARWHFCGVYLRPIAAQGGRARKGHARCMRCVVCRRPVRRDEWLDGARYGAPHRPYHRACWAVQCRRVGGHGQFVPLLSAQHAFTDVEVALMLAHAIRTDDFESVASLLELRPDIQTRTEMPRARRIAAEAGRVHILRLLLERSPECLDLFCRAEGALESLRVAALGPRENDVYVRQYPLTYNGRDVYIGQANSLYLYYYAPPPSGADPHAPGWCLSAHLGDGTPTLRLSLDTAASHAACAAAHAPATDGADRANTTNTTARPGLRALGTALRRIAAPADRCIRPVPDGGHAPDGWAPSAPPPPAPLVSPEGAGLSRVPHTFSLLEAAAASGDEATIRFTARAYKTAYPQCLVWEHHIGRGLWDPYPADTQAEICAALRAGQHRLVVAHDGGFASLDLRALRYGAGAAAPAPDQRLRSRLRTAFQYYADGRWAVTCDPGAVADWGRAFVLSAPGSVAAAAAGEGALRLLHAEGAVDPSLWAPPAADPAARGWALPEGGGAQGWYDAVFCGFVAAALDVAEGAVGDLPGGGGRSRARRRGAGVSRFSDGLAAPRPGPAGALWGPDYRCELGTLQFCLALPDNGVGLAFGGAAVRQMCADAVVKAHELQRQREPLSARHVLPIYVYTYELPEGNDQIYGAMNRAMREHCRAGLAFWRPLIWRLDRALQLLPAFRGRLYRGVGLQFGGYAPGGAVCWPAFSSASARKAVALEFAQGDAGSLFFLQSASARAISRFSNFPCEDEALFRPDTAFRISSVLPGSSEIGQFYSNVDNVAMEEVAAGAPSDPRADGARGPVPSGPAPAGGPPLDGTATGNPLPFLELLHSASAPAAPSAPEPPPEEHAAEPPAHLLISVRLLRDTPLSP